MIPEHVQFLIFAAAAFYCAVRWGAPVFFLAALHQIWVGEWGAALMLACLAAFFDTVRRITIWLNYVDVCERRFGRWM
jgi:hypothetical protein